MSPRSIFITVLLLLFTAVTLSAASAASAVNNVNETATVLDVLEVEDSKGNWTSNDLMSFGQTAPQIAYARLSDLWCFDTNCTSISSSVGSSAVLRPVSSNPLRLSLPTPNDSAIRCKRQL